MRRLADTLYRVRLATLVAILVVTALFGWKLRNLDISTHFLDLYPNNHPYVQLFEKYPAFGSPLTVTLLVKVRHGTLYNPQTLEKIQRATQMFDLIPGVDHEGIISIASRKVKHMEATVNGVQSTYLLVGAIPQTPEEIATFQEKVRTTAGVIGTLVSPRGDAALVQATFIEQLSDYGTIFDSVNRIISELNDADHELSAAGQPILTGWVYHYEREMYVIFGIGFLAMVILLAVYFRNLEGVLVPALVGIVSGIWGFGFAGLLGYNLDPLIIVVPILLVARALSHSVQMCERYFEIYNDTRDVRESCIESLVSLFPPGVVGILSDAAGLFLIAIAPIRLIDKLAYVCGLWSLTLVVTAIVLTFLLLSFFPPPRNVEDVVLTRAHSEGVLYRVFSFISFFSATPARSLATCLVFVAITLLAAWTGLHRQLGDVHPGTSLLWPDSPYNQAVADINSRFAGFDVLQVVLETDKSYGIETVAALDTMQRFQRYMEEDPDVGGTFSFGDLVPATNRLFRGGYPKWQVVPDDDAAGAMIAQLAMGNATPGDFDRVAKPPHFDAANISVWYKDHRGETIERALARARLFIKANNVGADGSPRLELAVGSMGLLAAVNETIGSLEITTVLLISLVIFCVTSFIYRSLTAGLLLVVIANMAYLMTTAIMYAKGIGLDVDTFPVAAVGMGIGIDYNIYLMSRMCEEYDRNPDYAVLVPTSIFTTGKAIFFTATTMIAGVIIWDVFSSLRFQADMGLLLAAVMLAHVILALFFQAAVMRLIKPSFLRTGLVITQTRKEG